MIGQFSKHVSKPKIYLCKPNINRRTIANLKEAYQIQRTVTRGSVGELSFNLPVSSNNFLAMELERNKHIDQIKERFIIRFELEQEVEYYLIDKFPKIMDDKDYVTINCYSLGYELASKNIKDYAVVSYNARQILNDMLKGTIWNIGFIDAQFDLKYRTFDYSGSVLDAVNQIAEKFVALVVWDTKNRQINFYDPETYGVNKGFKTKLGKLMKGVQQELNMDEFCTRLKLFGKDGLSIQSVNPLGTNFIQDFSYFMYPFEMDASGNVIRHSDYMEDDLCIAILRYNNLVNTNTPTFKSYLDQLKGFQTQLATKRNELNVLQNQLDIILDQLDTYNGTNTSGTPNTSLINQKTQKETEITNKNAEITSVNNQITSVNQSIQNMNNTLKMENNFTRDQLIELNQFILESELSDENYTNAQDLWDDGRRQFDKMRSPKIIVELSIVNFYSILTEKHNAKKLSVGDIVTVEHEILKINIKAHVTEIRYDYSGNTIDITVSNATELITDKERFMKEHQKNISTSNTVDMSKYKWDDTVATVDDVTQILNSKWDSAKRAIAAGTNEEVEIGRRGIIIRDPRNPLKMLIMQHGQIALTNNGGNTWQTAIDPSGVYAQTLAGKIILGNKLSITDDRGTFQIEGNLLTVKDASGTTRIQLGEYTSGQYGLKIISKKGNVLLDENGIVQTYTTQMMDNVAPNYPLRFRVFIPQSIISVAEAQLNFSSEPFRAFSTATESSPSFSTTSGAGGAYGNTTLSNFQTTPTTTAVPVSGQSMTNGSYNEPFGHHNHGIADGTRFALYGTNNTVSGFATWSSSGGHSHPISLAAHTHNITIDPHSHSFSVPNHTHDVYINGHTHGIRYGIYESSSATGMSVYVDGVYRAGTFTGSTNNANLTQWLSSPGWHNIEIHSQSLGRINAALFMRTFLGA